MCSSLDWVAVERQSSVHPCTPWKGQLLSPWIRPFGERTQWRLPLQLNQFIALQRTWRKMLGHYRAASDRSSASHASCSPKEEAFSSFVMMTILGWVVSEPTATGDVRYSAPSHRRGFDICAKAMAKADAPYPSAEGRSYMFSATLYVIPIVLILALIMIQASVRILREYERAVVFTLGRFQAVMGPGLMFMVPFVQKMVRVDLRIQVIEIPSQDVISRDNVSMKVDAVLYFNVVNPERAIIQVQNYIPATMMLAQTTLRAVLGQHELDEMLSERKKLSSDVQNILDTQTETWGIKVTNVEIRTVELTDNMVRAIAKQAEAERDRRAKVIHAEAEFQASQTLVDAAKILGSIPAAMQLRYLQTLTEIGAEQNSTVVFPMPIDIIRPFLDLLEQAGEAPNMNGAIHAPLVTEGSLHH
jgi:regulator of protease activity HflC (stomatin/prohibitin superfamily)